MCLNMHVCYAECALLILYRAAHTGFKGLSWMHSGVFLVCIRSLFMTMFYGVCLLCAQNNW